MMRVTPLELICERKIGDLLPDGKAAERWEASGVLIRDGACYVAFDNTAAVAVIGVDLQASDANGLCGTASREQGYEGIAYNPRKRRYYLLVESRKVKGGGYRPEIVEYDENFAYIKRRPMEFEFQSSNRGFEAVAYVLRRGRDYLLALCEGNKCTCGAAGRTPGGGRVQLFEKRKKTWAHVGTIKLPKAIPFADYSAMSIDDHRVVVASQESSMLWVGEFREKAWDWRDVGQLFEFPLTAAGKIQYGNVEGVAWLGPERVVAVSDKRKDDQPKRCAAKDQSIHVFELAGRGDDA